MILKASQRESARELARHLLNDQENDHVTLHEVRGFVADDLRGALDEAHAVSKGTRCRQFLFSLSINPPKDAEVSLGDMIAAADRVEAVTGLSGQPRAVVVHEKNGRRHIHVVWSRIRPDVMKAVNLPFFKTRLAQLSKDLYLEHGWELPQGHRTNGWKNPLNFTLPEWQQAKRLGLDPREIKQVFQEAWARSDNQASFAHALAEHGYYLARGDRRGFVAVDVRGEVFSVARAASIKTREINARLGDPDGLPSVESVRADVRQRLTKHLKTMLHESREEQARARTPLSDQRADMVIRQREERSLLLKRQEHRRMTETRERAARLSGGLRGALDLLTGRAAAIRSRNDAEAYRCFLRDRDQREALFAAQSRERGLLQQEIDGLSAAQQDERAVLARRIGALLRGETVTDIRSTPVGEKTMADDRKDARKSFERAKSPALSVPAAREARAATTLNYVLTPMGHTRLSHTADGQRRMEQITRTAARERLRAYRDENRLDRLKDIIRDFSSSVGKYLSNNRKELSQDKDLEP